MQRTFYRRRLPHWTPPGAALFVNGRLYDSLPASFRHSSSATDGKEFARWDKAMDLASSGPTWLRDPEIAGLVADSFRHGQNVLALYTLDAWVVMPNHVHLLIQPKADLVRITKALKNYTAGRANAALHRKGLPFWQSESFDHWVRHEAEHAKIVRYIENNPVKAGLAARPEDWRWSSAYVAPE